MFGRDYSLNGSENPCQPTRLRVTGNEAGLPVVELK